MKKILIIIVSCLFLLSNFIVFSVCLAAGKTPFEKGLDDTAQGVGYTTDGSMTFFLATTIGKVIGAVLSFLGVVFLVLMIYGGYLWMLARGNEQEVEKAKNIIQNALIGLVIVLAAYAITALVRQIWFIA